MLTHERVDITSARFKADPFSFYERLRRDHPVCSVALPNGKPAWLISRYDDVVAALKDPRLVKNRRNVPGSKKAGLAWTPKMFEPLTQKHARFGSAGSHPFASAGAQGVHATSC